LNLNYDKIRRRMEDGGNHWTSYSDLFLVLSVVFLLLYVISNIRSGAMTMAQQTQLIQAKAEADNLKKQIKTYDVLSEDYVKNGASNDEVKVYHELMDKIDLLQTDAKTERDEAAKKAQDADSKEKSLNYYQQLVKNIINANLVASGKVKKRDVVIEGQDKDIENLNQTVETQEGEITKNNNTITKVQETLEKQIEQTKYAYRSKKNSKQKMDAEIAKLRNVSEEQISSLREKNSKTISELSKTRETLEEKNRQAEQLMTSLSSKETEYQNSISNLNEAHEKQMAKEKAAFDASMNELKLSDQARIAQERQYAAAVERKNQGYKEQLSSLSGDLNRTKQSIQAIEGKYQNSVKSLEQTNQMLAGDLAASQRKLNQQRLLAEQIQKNFAKAGINATVNGKTGDVVINFKDEYFDSGRSNLKNGMKDILEKTFPVYAKSLLENPKVSKQISSVEIVGFASPTYKGKSVNPNSLSEETRAAVNYNMDLSYQRAKAIFEHVFDTTKMQFDHQKELLPMVKVSGRSYLASEKLAGRSTAALKDGEDYCSVFDCKKSQRVIIKFNLKEE
jgi:chromosome segregation ATPase